MKPKLVNGPRGRVPRHKAIKREMEITENIQESGFHSPQNGNPSVKIVSCISYQKFRYSGENRPGKKYQEKDFMELELNNLGEKVVRIVIICTDADNKELIHPNGLVGKDCHDGIYDKEYAVTKQNFNIKIPYLRTERIKTKKNEYSKIRNILKSRAGHLPSPYRERCESQCTDQYTFNRKFDTTKVCLGVIVTVKSHLQGAVNGSLHAISHVVNNASEKTALGILKLSQYQFSLSKGGLVDVFTTEEGPAIENDKYLMYVSYEGQGIKWESEKYCPTKEDILYKRIISYNVPAFDPNPDNPEKVEASLHLDCPQSNQSCISSIIYSPHEEDVVFYEPHNLKRSFSGELEELKPSKQMRLEEKSESITIKEGLKEYIKKRDGRKNSLPQAVQIIEADENGSVITHDDHTIQNVVFHNTADKYTPEQYSQSLRQQNDQGFQNLKVLAAAYSNSVPSSNTVVIITNDGTMPEDIDIENVISKGVSYFEKPSKGGEGEQQMIIMDTPREAATHQHLTLETVPAVNSVVISTPEAHKIPNDIHSKESSIDKSALGKDEESGRVSKSKDPSSTPLKERSSLMSPQKKHKNESPWAVDSDDDGELAYKMYGDLSFEKEPRYGRMSSYNQERVSVSSASNSRNAHEKIVHVEKQRVISVLTSKVDSIEKVGSKDSENAHTLISQLENTNLDFSGVPLPSDINLNSENISKYEFVKAVMKDL